MDKDMPADWAIGRACELADCRSMKEDIVRKHKTHWGDGAVVALARYIEAHEQPPVDPDLVTAREICAMVAGYWHGTSAENRYLKGRADNDAEVQFAPRQAKRGARQMKRNLFYAACALVLTIAFIIGTDKAMCQADNLYSERCQ